MDELIESLFNEELGTIRHQAVGPLPAGMGGGVSAHRVAEHLVRAIPLPGDAAAGATGAAAGAGGDSGAAGTPCGADCSQRRQLSPSSDDSVTERDLLQFEVDEALLLDDV